MKNCRFALQLGLAGALLLAVGCRQDMHDQPKYIPLRSSAFWGDGMGSRTQVPGTVARGQLRADAYYYTGKNGVMEGDRFPFRTGQVRGNNHQGFAQVERGRWKSPEEKRETE